MRCTHPLTKDSSPHPQWRGLPPLSRLGSGACALPRAMFHPPRCALALSLLLSLAAGLGLQFEPNVHTSPPPVNDSDAGTHIGDTNTGVLWGSHAPRLRGSVGVGVSRHSCWRIVCFLQSECECIKHKFGVLWHHAPDNSTVKCAVASRTLAYTEVSHQSSQVAPLASSISPDIPSR